MKLMKAILALTVVALAGCAHSKKHGGKDHDCKCGDKPKDLKAVFESKSGSKVSGFTILEIPDSGGNVKAHYKVEGLKANGTHGFHIHEKGDCSAKDASTAGGHWNPTAQPHADHSAAQRHAGDMGNIKADAKGVAVGEIDLPGVTLDQLKNLSIIVHEKADDGKTQPTGNAGGRLACGVIKPFDS